MNIETVGMEECSEAHMETDVSSTTEDLPDTQEVTGSNGTVEMVIVVEKVCEEDMNEKIEKQLDKNDSVSMVLDEPPLTATPPHETETKSPTKDVEPQPITQPCTTKPESPKKTSDSRSPLKIQSPPPNKTDNEVVDSSSKSEDVQLQNVDSQITTEVSTVVNCDQQKSEVIPPIKEVQSPDSSKTKNNINEPDKSNTTENLEVKNKEEQNIPNNIIQVDITMEASNDSQLETNSDTSEKEHNKSISRELKSLIKSAKESKIISECTQLTSKTRKSRVVLDSSNTSLNTSVEADKIHGARRNSNNSQKSNCSEKSDKMPLKRSMRSQNPEFVSKVKQFLNSVTGKNQKDDEITDDEIEDKVNHKIDESMSNTSTPKKRKVEEIVMNKTTKLRSDSYCWRCHWAVEQAANEKTHQPMLCTVCPRSFHFKCLSGSERNKINIEKNWVCPDCLIILHAESSETRSPAMKKISLGMLCELLQHALERMMDLNGVEPFMTPVDRLAFPDYDKYVVHPMDLSLMKSNISDGQYGSTEAFLGDAQWILHNSIIFNTLQSKLTGGARALVRSCRAEMGEIEACPECYAAAHARRPTWFTDVCSTPHVLLWAKLKGFPYWPAKGMSVSGAGLVDVRFFGAHDRAWVPAKDCFLYSEKDPNNFRTKRQDILDSMQEAEQHIRNISRKYGKFVYPPFKTQFEPMKLNEQLKMMIPTFEGEVRVPMKQDKSNGSPSVAKEKSRSNSKSSKSSCNDGDVSELEDPLALPQVKADTNDNDFSTDKAKIMEVDISKTKDKETESGKKRRRSQLEEAIITILDSYAVEKRKRVDGSKTDDSPGPSSSKETNDKNKDKEKANDKQEEKNNTLKDEESNRTAGKDKNETQEKSDKPTVAPLKISFASNKNGKQTAKVTNLRESPKATTSNGRSLVISKTSTPKEDKSPAQKLKSKTDKLFIDKRKEEKVRTEKRRNSKNNKSLNGNITPKIDKQDSEKKDEKANELSAKNSEKIRENVATKNNHKKTTDADKTINNKVTSTANNSRASKDHASYEDDTSLAVLARENKNNIISSNTSGLPTISSVRSLSTIASTSSTTTTNSSNVTKMIEVTIEGNPNAHIFTPTSTDNIRSMKEATSKLQKLRAEAEPLVGRVGVRAFARMKSPEKSKNDGVQVEIKTEPIDLDDADRHMEKMDLMNAFKLRPVNPPSNLREVVITPLNRKTANKIPEIRPRAKKTFPHPKKPEDGQLNGKNSMVYIPIQPPVTQAPPRINRPATVNLVNAGHRPLVSINASAVNTVTSPLVPVITSMTSAMVTTTTQVGQSIPTIGQVPTTVHTVPLMTSVNGQWMFSLQPVMSVGGIDAQPSSPLVNGVGERGVVQAVQSVQAVSTVPAVMSPALATLTPAPVPAPAPAPSPMSPAPMPAPALGATPTPLANKSTVEPLPTTPGEMTTNPTNAQIDALLAFLEEHRELARGNVRGTEGRNRSLNLWTRLTDDLNALDGCVKSVKQWQKVWADKKYLAKKAVASARRYASTTASGRYPVEMVSAQELRIISVVGMGFGDEETYIDLLAIPEPPRLQQRPALLNPLDTNTPMGTVPPPSTAGPLTAKLNQNAVKLTEFFRTLLEDSLEKLDEPATHAAVLRLQLEHANWKHQQLIDEIKHNHELTLAEVRASFEKEKVRAVNEARRLAQVELQAAVKQAKTKQWCANCSQEAQFYCCWNTSYCDYPCQRAHWSQHFHVCTQKPTQDSRDENGDGSSPPEDRLQPQPDNLPKSTSVPALTVGGKLAPRLTTNPNTNLNTNVNTNLNTNVNASVNTNVSTNVNTNVNTLVSSQEQQNNALQTSIIMSMVKDTSGNQSMKCVGTYSPQKHSPPLAATAAPIPSVIINKQLMAAEEANAKKVVTSGGYLIMGGGVAARVGADVTAGVSTSVSAGVSAAVSATAARRMHTIQYFT